VCHVPGGQSRIFPHKRDTTLLEHEKVVLIMRICMFNRALPQHSIGGMELNSMQLAHGLVSSVDEVTMITTAHPSYLGKDTMINDMGVRTIFLGDTACGAYSEEFHRKSTRLFRSLHKSEPFDLVHSHNSGALGLHKAGILRQCQVPLVVTWYGTHIDWVITTIRSDLLSLSRQGFRDFLSEFCDAVSRYFVEDLWLTRSADAVIAIDREAYQKIRGQYFLPKHKVRIVYTSVDTDFFMPQLKRPQVLRKWGLESNQPILLVLARLIREKGIQNAILALPALVRDFPQVHLMIVGDGPYRSELEGLATDTGVMDHVTFTGAVTFEACPDYYNLCDLFINPTLQTSGYNTTLVQAMSCEKVVVTSEGSGTEALTDSGTNGFIIPKGSVEDLVSVVSRMLSDQTARETIGRAARLKVEAEFSVKSMISATIKLYRDLTSLRGQLQ